jgi:uncharacterized protein YabN with tetrapyrrole methylase and pyrophosphatase domain
VKTDNLDKQKLFIVGCGIKFLSHLTQEVKLLIENADCVAYHVNEPATKKWINENCRNPYSLDGLYFDQNKRKDVYKAISSEVIRQSKMFKTTCFVTYGHPFFLSNAARNIVSEIEKNHCDIKVESLPGISSLDVLFSDLRVDPSFGGMQAIEATEYLNKKIIINKSSHIVIWQVGVVGVTNIINDEIELEQSNEKREAIRALKHLLLETYTPDKSIILYVASMYQSIQPEIIELELKDLDKVFIPRLATMYISPPTSRAGD